MFLRTLQSSKSIATANIDVASKTTSFARKVILPYTSWHSYIPTDTRTPAKRHYSQTSTFLQSQESQRTALVLGSSGSLGSTIASQLKSNHDCIVIGSDIHPPSEGRIDCIDAFIQLPTNSQDISIDSLYTDLRNGLRNLYNENEKDIQLDAIICANGGFSMDDDEEEFYLEEGDIENHDGNHDEGRTKSKKGHVYETMLQMNYYPVLAAGEIAKSYMSTKSNQSTLFVAFGAVAALSPAPNMIAYTSSKVLTHYYIQTIGSMTGHALKKEYKIQRTNEMGIKMRREGLHLDSMSALGILPIMLDTESNRKALPDEDFNSWTKTEDIAKEIGVWMDTPELRPHSGSLVKVVTTKGESRFRLAR